MALPKLDPITRSREYDSYNDDLRGAVVRGWIFEGKTHRELDREVLGLNPKESRGYQSMGILHFLGLKKEFRGLFDELEEFEAINLLKNDGQEFGLVLDLLHKNDPSQSISLTKLKEEEEAEIKVSAQASSEERKNEIAEKSTKPERMRVFSFTYRRNPHIAAEALYRASGCCEQCKKPAPFFRASDGTPFLEIHHVKPLAEGGHDSLDNVMALCPNCHRKVHYG
jgi:5-methylcytosine-specific restriction enzyme A